MRKILVPILFTLLAVAFGIGHERLARAQVMENVPLVIGASPEFDPATLFDPSQLAILGTISAEKGTETWEWNADPINEVALIIWRSTEKPQGGMTLATVMYEIDDVPAADGCGTSYLPKPRTGSETWAVYNAVKGKNPKLVGVRYVSPRGDELWYVSDDYVYGGEKDSYLIMAKDGTVERDPSWAHTIRMSR